MNPWLGWALAAIFSFVAWQQLSGRLEVLRSREAAVRTLVTIE